MDNGPVTKETETGTAKARRTGGRPRRLERETIVATARRILEEEGTGGLSMRRLAKEVGATPMALYRHVRDKDELLQLVLAGTARTRPRPGLPEDPRERVHTTALHMLRTLQELPWVVEVLSLGELTDKDALWMVEEIIDSAMACGQSERRAVHTYRSIWHHVLGTLVFRTALARRAEAPDRHAAFPSLLTDTDPAELPRLSALADRWDGITDTYDPAEELRAVVNGLLDRTGDGA